MKAIVTGGSGFIGSSLVELLIKEKMEVFNLSKHTYTFNPKVLSHLKDEKLYAFLPLDITNGSELYSTIEKISPDIIFHLAAETHVDRSFIYPKDFLESNLIGTFNILECIRHLKNIPLLIYMSTDEVFGNVPEGLSKETDRILPRNPYSASKASCELFVLAYYYSFKVPGIIVRSMNNYGPRQNGEKLIAKILTSCLLDKEYSLYLGDSIRGWLYVEDTCKALYYISRNGQLGEIYHIPARSYLKVSEVNHKILEIMKKHNLFKGFEGRRLKDDERYALDGTKLKDLGWEPEYSFDDGIVKTIDWYKNNEWFWKGVYSP